ncbi:unnamed protein product [Rhizoctonia solani]|uniref:Uncharacterized protein n=1 Tax=Rhizoctonia solani TaxID=456999 RepID=A0A8H3CB27_9AGAM|nr:unnamed protein product [Rhizoctonia solani]
MIFSRCLLVILAAVGVIAHSGHAEKRGMVKVHADLARRGYHEDGMAKLKEYQMQTTDAMAGPQPEREAKLTEITKNLVPLVKTYNSNLMSGLDLSNLGKLRQHLSLFGEKLYVIVRSCKGTRSEAVYNNIHALNVEVDSLGDFLAQKLPSTMSAQITSEFAKYSDRIDMIEVATKPF